MSDEIDERLKADKELEDRLKARGDVPLHSLVERITHRLGSLNIIRNARNQKQEDINKIDEQS